MFLNLFQSKSVMRLRPFPLQISARIIASYIHCNDPDACIAKLRIRDDLAVSVSRKHATSNPVVAPNEMFCFTPAHNVYGFSVTMLAQRDFHLLRRMNSIIRRAMEFGLIQKWEGDDAASSSSMPPAANALHHHEELVVLRVDNIMGALILMAAGYALAIVAFAIEIGMNAKWVKRRMLRLWRFCDSLLNGGRMCWS